MCVSTTNQMTTTNNNNNNKNNTSQKAKKITEIFQFLNAQFALEQQDCENQENSEQQQIYSQLISQDLLSLEFNIPDDNKNKNRNKTKKNMKKKAKKTTSVVNTTTEVPFSRRNTIPGYHTIQKMKYLRQHVVWEKGQKDDAITNITIMKKLIQYSNTTNTNTCNTNTSISSINDQFINSCVKQFLIDGYLVIPPPTTTTTTTTTNTTNSVVVVDQIFQYALELQKLHLSSGQRYDSNHEEEEPVDNTTNLIHMNTTNTNTNTNTTNTNTTDTINTNEEHSKTTRLNLYEMILKSHTPILSLILNKLLGQNYLVLPMTHMHWSYRGRKDQHWHRDNIPHYKRFGANLNLQLNHVMVMYYPQNTTLDLGPTAVRRGSHYSLDHYVPDRLDYTFTSNTKYNEVALPCDAGSIVLMHYDLIHRRMANLLTDRFMFKFMMQRSVQPCDLFNNNNNNDTNEELVERRMEYEMVDTRDHIEYNREWIDPLAKSVWNWIHHL